MHDDLINDGTFICKTCEEIIKAFTSSGETRFCPACGSTEIENLEEDE